MDLHWLPVCYIAQYKLLRYVFKALNGLAHVYLKDPVTVYEPARTLHSENALLVVQPKVRTKTYGERRFDKVASTLWIVFPATLDMNNALKPSKCSRKLYFLDAVILLKFSRYYLAFLLLHMLIIDILL